MDFGERKFLIKNNKISYLFNFNIKFLINNILILIVNGTLVKMFKLVQGCIIDKNKFILDIVIKIYLK